MTPKLPDAVVCSHAWSGLVQKVDLSGNQTSRGTKRLARLGGPYTREKSQTPFSAHCLALTQPLRLLPGIPSLCEHCVPDSACSLSAVCLILPVPRELCASLLPVPRELGA